MPNETQYTYNSRIYIKYDSDELHRNFCDGIPTHILTSEALL